MKETRKQEVYEEFRSHDKLLYFMFFLASGLFGYLLTHFTVLRGA